MNAKVKLVAAIVALQLIVPAVLAQPVVPVVPASSVYQITGRVIHVDPRSVVIRSRSSNTGDLTILRREDTRFWSQIRPGDVVTIKYNLMATDVVLSAPARPMPPRYR